jgi:hypothetical protein
MHTGRIYTENRILGLYGIAQESGRKKEKTARKRTRNGKWIHMIRTDKGLSSLLTPVPLTSHLSEWSVNRPSPHAIRLPRPHDFAPPPPGSDGQTSHQTAATPGTWKEWDCIQRAAAMRVTRVATASDSGKVTAREQPNPAFSVDSPFCSRTYADFITDVELLQAKTEVEECYRRQTWRAGLGDTLPEGRPMTEEELEDLQWQLGDFGQQEDTGATGSSGGRTPST